MLKTPQIEKILLEFESLKNNQPYEAQEGKEVYIKNTVPQRLKKIQLLGNHSQETREGYNLLPINIYNDATWATDVSENTESLNLLGAGDYIFSAKFKLESKTEEFSDSDRFGIGISNSNKNYAFQKEWNSSAIGTIVELKEKITITDDMVGEFTHFYVYGSGNNNYGKTGSALAYDMQLIKGTTEKTYEAYGATPSPEFESQIECITGDVDVKAQNENWFDSVNCGRGTIDINENYTENLPQLLPLAPDAKYFSIWAYLKAGTYTLLQLNTNYWLSINRIAIAGTLCKNSSEHLRRSYTFTQEVDGWTVFSFERDASESDYTDTELGTADINDFQFIITRDMISTNCIPHQENSHILHLGNLKMYGNSIVRDYFYRIGENWHSKHNYRKVILNSSSNIRKNSSSNIDSYLYYLELEQANIHLQNNNVYCNYLKKVNEVNEINNNIKNGILLSSSNNGQNIIYFNPMGLIEENTLENLKAKLDEIGNFEIVYQLAEPKDELILDTQLIADLNAIEEMSGFEGDTIITSDSDMYFKVEAYQDINRILTEKEKNYNERIEALESAILSLGGIN